MNTDLLTKVRDHIHANTETFDMRYWFSDGDGFIDPDQVLRAYREGYTPNCGYAACFGGWAVLLADPQHTALRATWDGIDDIVLDLCDLTDETHRGIFYVEDWPQQARDIAQDNGEADGMVWILDELIAGRNPWHDEDPIHSTPINITN